MNTSAGDRPHTTYRRRLPLRARQGFRAAAPLCFAALATLLASLGAAASLHGVISDWGWLSQVTLVVLAMVLATNLARYAAAPVYLVPAAGLLAGTCALTLLFFSNTAWFGFIPTTSTYRALMQVWSLANEQMASQVPPVQSTGVIVFSVTLWVAVVALAVDTLAFTLRAAATAGLPLAMLPVIASLFEPQGAGIGSVTATALGYLLILAAARWIESGTADRRGRRLAVEIVDEAPGGQAAAPRPGNSWIQGTVLLAGAAASLLVLPLVVPGFTKGMLVEGTRPSGGALATNVDPMITLGNDLRNNASGTVLRYYTNDTEPLYLRTSVIGNLEGRTWQPSEDLLRVPATERLATPTIPTMFGLMRESTTRIVTDKYRGVWLPMPGNAELISGLPGHWRWSPDTGTMLAGEDEAPAAQDYLALSLTPEITAESLIGWTAGSPAGFFDTVNAEYSQIPGGSPKSLPEATAKALDGFEDASAFEQAVAIQNHLRSGAFAYSEKTPLQEGYDGSGMRVIEAFLQKRSGYCVHFASTMAMMARTLDIPSRIVTGYSPGTATGASLPGTNGSTLNEFVVDSRNAHAWPELYFHGAGWVAFEPTPGRGVPPEYAPALAAQNPAPEADPRPSNPTASRPTAPSAAAGSSAAAGATGSETETSPAPLWPALAVFTALVVAAIPRLLRGAQRRKRMRTVGGAGAAWAELVALGLDYSRPMRQNESAGDYARRLATVLPEAERALMLLAEAYERQRYAPAPAPTNHGALGTALDAVQRAFAAQLSPGARLAALLWPRSVFAPRAQDSGTYMAAR